VRAPEHFDELQALVRALLKQVVIYADRWVMEGFVPSLNGEVPITLAMPW
jgi:hypothetical protein